MRLSATVLNTPDPRALAAFYQRLLGWTIVTEEPDWVILLLPGGGTGLSFQTEAIYRPPVWPAAPSEQQMMLHLDIAAEDLESAVVWAAAARAVPAGHQPQDDVRAMLDPARHPFCLFAGPV